MSPQTTLLESTKGGLWTIAVPSLAAFAPSHSSLGLYLVSTLDQLLFALLLFHSTHSQLCSFPLYHSVLDSKVSALDTWTVYTLCATLRCTDWSVLSPISSICDQSVVLAHPPIPLGIGDGWCHQHLDGKIKVQENIWTI